MKRAVEMPLKEHEIIVLKKLKKDGSIEFNIIEKTAAILREGGMVVMPVDNIYGIVGMATPEMERKISKLIGKPNKRFVRLIANYKNLDEIARIDKFQFDFLHRLWPGEVTVILPRKNDYTKQDEIAVRIPKNKLLSLLLEYMDRPLIYSSAFRKPRKIYYKKDEIINAYRDRVDLILIIEELCKRHPESTIINVSKEKLKIVREGKVPVEEIKSLYFLGKDDDYLY
ncbi:MAG: L-threonylcarbamoyladenylate synthase [Spirochaetota bacterium]